MHNAIIPEIQICRDCGEIFPATLEYFRIGKRGKLSTRCKECQRDKERKRDTEIRRRDGIPVRRRFATEEERRLARKAASKSWMQKHPEKRREIEKSWEARNRLKINAQQRQIRQQNPERYASYDAKRYLERREAKIEAFKVYYNHRRATDPDFRLKEAVSCMIYQALRANKAGRKWESLVGYTLADLKAHLENQFVSGMTWKNYGEWHLDHIQPRASFVFTSSDDEQFKKCWALSNLRPLWAEENLRRGSLWRWHGREMMT